MDIISQLERKIDVRETIDKLKSDGVCFIESLLDHDTVNRLNDEFQRVFDELPLGVSMGKHPPGRMATIDTLTCNPVSLPTIFSVFMSSQIRTVSEGILPKGSNFNDKIVMTHETKVMPISDIHFDSQRTLKIMIYLLDTNVSNGAFCYGKGSNVENAAYRKKYLSQGGQLLDLQNVLSETELDTIDLERINGPAGSMVIFDTDGWHSGGRLEDDTKERRIIRSRSIFAGQSPLRPNRFSPLWFRRRFNIFPPRRPFEIPGRERTGGTSRRK